jgi:CubicO group peptidase (beta-lactamase class C family)
MPTLASKFHKKKIIMRHLLLFLAITLSYSIVSAQLPQTFRKASASEGGFDAARLLRIDTLMNNYVRDGILPNAVTLIAHKGVIVQHKAYGYSHLDTKTPARTDDIYRIMSQTKLITTVGLLMLMEQGMFHLDEPISKWIPAFKNPKVMDVFDAKEPEKYTTRPAKTEITIRHLLSHTSGIPYGSPVSVLPEFQFPLLASPKQITLAEWVEKIATRPLDADPGTKFIYGLNTDVAGRLIEVMSGQPLDVYLRTKVLEPLGMMDTYFFLPDSKAGRLVELYSKEKTTDPLTPHNNEDFRIYPIKGAKALFSGGSGMNTTIEDYAKLCQMILNGGEFNGKRLLSRATVATMERSQIGENSVWERKDKFGLGLEIFGSESHYGDIASPGAMMWGGYFCSEYTIDPKEELIMLVFTNVQPFAYGDEFLRKFRILAYSALK